MKKSLIIFLSMLVLLTLIPEQTVTAHDEFQYDEPFKIRATCYTWTGNRCANGDYPVEGVTVAAKKEWIGKTIIMYEVDEDGSCGKCIGFYEVTDTGYGIKKTDSNGNTYGTIQAGESIDVYRDDMDSVNEWISNHGDYVYITIVDAKG